MFVALHKSTCSPAPSLPLLLTDLGWRPRPRSHTTHTLHTIASAVLTPRWPTSCLPESPGDDRCSAHICMLVGFPSAADQPPVSHTTHTTRHNFGCAHSHTATKLPGCISLTDNDSDRRAAHIRMLVGFPSAADQPPVSLPMYICTCTNTR